jgi:hypothetical protein
MIAGVKWWYVACATLLFFLPPHATAADDLNGAARELARKTAALPGRGETVSVAWRNLSSLGAAELSRARAAFETAMRDAGARAVEAASGETSITLSENRSQYLLVEEVRKGDERQVWIAAWNRPAAAGAFTAAVTLEKKLLFEADEPILDAALSGETMVALSASKVTWFARQNGQSVEAQKVDLPAPRSWPRDLRGRLRVSGGGLQASLPGMSCRVMLQSAPVECRTSEEPWVLESGAQFLLAANFTPGRNYFDGRLTTQTGAKKTVAPFYSAAAVEENGRPMWLLAMVDGGTLLFDSGFESLGQVGTWGSDMAGVETRCASGNLVLATRAGDGTEVDAIQAFGVVNRAAVLLASALDVPGPVTALWPSAAGSAVAVVRDLRTGKYAAYLITVACGG